MADVILSITVPESLVTRVTDALCHPQGFNWDGENPPTKKEFAEQIVANAFREEVRRIEKQIREAVRQAVAQSITDAEEAQAVIDNVILDTIG